MKVEKLLIKAGIPVTSKNVDIMRKIFAELNDKLEAEKCV